MFRNVLYYVKYETISVCAISKIDFKDPSLKKNVFDFRGLGGVSKLCLYFGALC